MFQFCTFRTTAANQQAESNRSAASDQHQLLISHLSLILIISRSVFLFWPPPQQLCMT